jgi:hypothetical protein
MEHWQFWRDVVTIKILEGHCQIGGSLGRYVDFFLQLLCNTDIYSSHNQPLDRSLL